MRASLHIEAAAGVEWFVHRAARLSSHRIGANAEADQGSMAGAGLFRQEEGHAVRAKAIQADGCPLPGGHCSGQVQCLQHQSNAPRSARKWPGSKNGVTALAAIPLAAASARAVIDHDGVAIGGLVEHLGLRFGDRGSCWYQLPAPGMPSTEVRNWCEAAISSAPPGPSRKGAFTCRSAAATRSPRRSSILTKGGYTGTP